MYKRRRLKKEWTFIYFFFLAQVIHPEDWIRTKRYQDVLHNLRMYIFAWRIPKACGILLLCLSGKSNKPQNFPIITINYIYLYIYKLTIIALVSAVSSPRWGSFDVRFSSLRCTFYRTDLIGQKIQIFDRHAQTRCNIVKTGNV